MRLDDDSRAPTPNSTNNINPRPNKKNIKMDVENNNNVLADPPW
jgi:hypothetical protein